MREWRIEVESQWRFRFRQLFTTIPGIPELHTVHVKVTVPTNLFQSGVFGLSPQDASVLHDFFYTILKYAMDLTYDFFEKTKAVPLSLGATVVQLNDGALLIGGGEPSAPYSVLKVREMNIPSARWAPSIVNAKDVTNRYFHASVSLSGKAYTFGGTGRHLNSDSLVTFDEVVEIKKTIFGTQASVIAHDPIVAKQGLCAHAFTSKLERCVVFGGTGTLTDEETAEAGTSSSSGCSSSAYVFNPCVEDGGSSFVRIETVGHERPAPRAFHASAICGGPSSNLLVICGGRGDDSQLMNDVWVLDLTELVDVLDSGEGGLGAPPVEDPKAKKGGKGGKGAAPAGPVGHWCKILTDGPSSFLPRHMHCCFAVPPTVGETGADRFNLFVFGGLTKRGPAPLQELHKITVDRSDKGSFSAGGEGGFELITMAADITGGAAAASVDEGDQRDGSVASAAGSAKLSQNPMTGGTALDRADCYTVYGAAILPVRTDLMKSCGAVGASTGGGGGDGDEVVADEEKGAVGDAAGPLSHNPAVVLLLSGQRSLMPLSSSNSATGGTAVSLPNVTFMIALNSDNSLVQGMRAAVAANNPDLFKKRNDNDANSIAKPQHIEYPNGDIYDGYVVEMMSIDNMENEDLTQPSFSQVDETGVEPSPSPEKARSVEGEFSEKIPHGSGVMQYANGDKYDVRFLFDLVIYLILSFNLAILVQMLEYPSMMCAVGYLLLSLKVIFSVIGFVCPICVG